MRALKRLLLFWALALPASYIWGMPYMTDYVEAQTRQQNFTACKQQITEQGLKITAEQGDRYCTCINDGLNFEDGDLLTIARTRKAPDHVQQQLDARIKQCGEVLSNELNAQPAAPATPAPPPDGAEEIYL